MLNAIAGKETASRRTDPVVQSGAAKKVVIVNGSPDTLDLFEMVLDGGHYDVVFVESNEHAYSQIKRVQPNLVILCVSIDEMDGFHVLSMLKLDESTRGIPVLTYAADRESPDDEEESLEFADGEMFMRPAELMN